MIDTWESIVCRELCAKSGHLSTKMEYQFPKVLSRASLVSLGQLLPDMEQINVKLLKIEKRTFHPLAIAQAIYNRKIIDTLVA